MENKYYDEYALEDLKNTLEVFSWAKKFIVLKAEDHGNGTYTVTVQDNRAVYNAHLDKHANSEFHKKFNAAFDAAMKEVSKC